MVLRKGILATRELEVNTTDHVITGGDESISRGRSWKFICGQTPSISLLANGNSDPIIGADQASDRRATAGTRVAWRGGR